MVSLVIVSHSSKIAEGVRDLVDQVTQGQVRVIATGAVDGETLGTDYESVRKALREAVTGDSTLVLVDLGSAIITTEMALEELPPAARRRITLCEAPLVEGAVAAAAQIAAGASLEEAAAEARGALMPKVAQLGVGPANLFVNAEMPYWDAEALLTVSHPLGLHAGPASLFVRTASQFQSDVRIKNVTRNTRMVNAKSINSISLVDVRSGHDVLIAANGPDAPFAVSTLKELVENRFGAPDTPAPVAMGTRARALRARAVGSGAVSAVEGAMAFAATHYAMPLTSKETAEKVFLHPHYFCTVFKACTGMSFLDYLTKIRVARAKELLTRSNLRISDVAARVGFRDPNYFSRVFKRVQGLSPRDFRRQYCVRPGAG